MTAILHFIFPILMVLLGFLGVGLSSSSRMKVWSWGLFQAGWLFAIFEMEPHGEAVTAVIGGLFAAVTLALFGVLWVLARQAHILDRDAAKVPNRKGSK